MGRLFIPALFSTKATIEIEKDFSKKTMMWKSRKEAFAIHGAKLTTEQHTLVTSYTICQP